MGALLDILVRDASRAPMQHREEVAITTEAGLEGDYRGRHEGRQVTVVVREAWEAALKDLAKDLPWSTRRANLLVEGVNLETSTGQTLYIGDIVLHITGETLPCPRMEEACAGLQDALAPEWRGGVTCTVVQGGAIKIGDSVRVEAEVLASSGD